MPEPERVTIRRIAGELNLSSSTVSRALAGRPEISPETTRRVIETARRLGYRPPPEQRTVVLILPDTDGIRFVAISPLKKIPLIPLTMELAGRLP